MLKKSKKDNSVLFVDASAQFNRIGNKNHLTPANQQKILDAYIARSDIEHFAKLVSHDEIKANDYNISVSSFVEREDTRDAIDISALNAEISRIVDRQSELREQIDEVVAEMEAEA